MLPKGSNWVKVAWQGAEKGFQRELELTLKPQYEKEMSRIFADTQTSFVRDLPSHETPTMPFITGNLHDSIGAVTSLRGRVVKASYTDPVAMTSSELTKKEVYRSTSGMGRKKIVGSLSAFNMVKSLQGKYPTKLATMLFVAVPYALNPNEKGPHVGYLDSLRQLFAYALETEFRRAMTRGLLMMKGNLDQYIQIRYDSDDARIAPDVKRRGRPKGSGGYMGSAKPGMGMKLR